MRLCALLLTLLWVVVPAGGDTIYAAMVNGDILALDTVEMTSTVLAHTGTLWYDIAFASDGKLYGSDAYHLYLIDTTNGSTTLVGAFGTFINGLTFVDDTLYGSGGTGLYAINLSSGQAHILGSTGYGSSGDLQWFGGALYLTVTGDSTDLLLRVDPATGNAVLIGDTGFYSVFGLAAGTTDLFALTGGGDLLKMDPATGAGTRLGSSGGSVFGATSMPASAGVPEPSALLLLASGLTWLGLRGRSR